MLRDARALAIGLLAMRRNESLIVADRASERFGSTAFSRYGFNYWRRPTIGPFRDREQHLKLAFGSQDSVAIRFVDSEDVADLHNSRLHRLHSISHSRHK